MGFLVLYDAFAAQHDSREREKEEEEDDEEEENPAGKASKLTPHKLLTTSFD